MTGSLPKGILLVKVIPKTSREEIIGWEGGILKIRLKAVPTKGQANKALIAFLSKTLGVDRRSIFLLSGESGRHKRLEIHGMTQEKILKCLGHPSSERS